MKWAGLVLAVIGCGGSKPAPPPPPPPPEKKVTPRVETKDDEPEDGVKFVKQKGTITQEQIEAGLAPHKDAMMDCYTTKIGKRKWLGGEVMLHWDLKADGTVASVKMTQSNVGAWEVEKCLLDIAWGATFEKPSGGDAEFDLPLTFSPTRMTQDWDDDKSLRAIGGQLAELDDCPNGKPVKQPKKAKKPAKKPKPPPKPPDAKPERPEPRPPSNVLITLYVGPQGKTQAIGFSSPTSMIGNHWATCATKTALAWRLPDPKGQIAKLKVHYKAIE